MQEEVQSQQSQQESQSRVARLEVRVKELLEQIDQAKLFSAQQEQLAVQRAEELDYLQGCLKQKDCECERLLEAINEAQKFSKFSNTNSTTNANPSSNEYELILAKYKFIYICVMIHFTCFYEAFSFVPIL